MQKTTDIRNVRNVEDLLGYFADKLGWNVDPSLFESIDDISYDFTAADLGLADDAFARIRTLRQLRPFDGNQKWAMFCIEFDSRRFEVAAIRKILSELVPRRRKDPNRPVWNMRDILFLCDWGDDAGRTVGVAHFEERESGAPEVKLVSCAPAAAGADPQELRVFEERLSGLSWPRNTADTREWAAAWSSAFRTVYRGNIKKASELTQKLAEEALAIRRRILAAMSVESANGYVHLLWKKFRETLVADMSESDFADMYAQTIVYGLFSARCMDKTVEDFSVAEAVKCIPKTNPFLKQLMKDCLGVRSAKTALSFDELEIGDVVDLLLHTDIREVVRDFNRQTNQGREDPVIHFYEEFLSAYDRTRKVECGVFYTPQPVVDFIVRAVDDILRRDFGLADGLASTETRQIRPDPAKPRKTETVPAVQILDPATGTGTFLRQTILRIYETFRAKHAGEGEDAIRAAWNDYVPRHLLPRLNAFELMMAPYAVAHMKLAMVLKDTGYDFEKEDRLRVYLTNSLEEPGDSDPQGKLFDDDPLAIESIAANAVKKNSGINVVIGNPPYSGISQNNGEWITNLVNEYKFTDGVYFNERKHWLNDDYVKFIRLGQEFVTRGGAGVLAFITNHAFGFNPTFRAMRWNLLRAFDEIYILDLHGNSRSGESSLVGTDENVFDIQQGVSINIMVRHYNHSNTKLGRVFRFDLTGTREEKYDWLSSHSFDSVNWSSVLFSHPYYFFVFRDEDNRSLWEQFVSVKDCFFINTTGVVTARDELVIDFDKQALLHKIRNFSDCSKTDTEVRKEFYPNKKNGKYLAGDTRGWKLSEARQKIRALQHATIVRPYSYRVFDVRYIYYSQLMVDWGREKVFCKAMPETICLIAKRGYSREDAPPCFASSAISDFRFWSCSGMQGGDYIFPLYLCQDWNGEMQKVPNLNPEIVAKIETSLGEKTTPEDLFDYIYAVLHSPSYREKYKEFLKIDFPRIPYPSDAESFHALAALGAQLVAIHVMKDFDEAEDVTFEDGGDRIVGKVAWKDGDVFVNKKSCFAGVERETFDQYIGGYQPLQKWLKDRKGRALSDDDISHWKRIVRALRRTAALMSEIDHVRLVADSVRGR